MPLDLTLLDSGQAAPPALPHFPARFQAVLWRNWELVPLRRLADVLRAGEPDILAHAEALGLPVPPRVNPRWLEQGYSTLIRANWHLLPCDQLLELLGWDQARLAYALEFDDGLWNKLGRLKPALDPVACRPLAPAEAEATRSIRAAMTRYFTDAGSPPGEPPFGFLDALARPAPPAADAPGESAAPRFRPVIASSYTASFGELMDRPRPGHFPGGLLDRLAAQGVDGVWLPVLLRSVYPWEADPSLSAGWEARLEALTAVVEHVRRHGLGVYAYLLEPRNLPLSFFARHPGLKGIGLPGGANACCCTSAPEILDFLRDGAAFLFRRAPLAGALTITMSEAATHCYSRCTGGTDCPRCRERPVAEVVAEINAALAGGVRAARPDARFIAWTWAWNEAWAGDAVDRLPAGSWLLNTSEGGLKTRVGGVPFEVSDYSISQVGPSERSRALWRRARARGLALMAKVQLNTSWEGASVPYLPVPDLVEEHLQNLERAGITGLMVSWTCGGWPGGNMALLRHSLADWQAGFGAAAGPVGQASARFSAAFRELPYSIRLAYEGPQNVGPKNLLFEAPSGYRATMTGFPFDTLDRWRGAAPGSEFYPDGYPEDVFEAQFQALTAQWRAGLDLLREVPPPDADEAGSRLAEFRRVAEAAYTLYRSATLQIRFIRRRGRPRTDAWRAELAVLLDEEIELAVRLAGLMRADSRIGFEAANHYFFTVNEMREKVLNCLDLKARMTGPVVSTRL